MDLGNTQAQGDLNAIYYCYTGTAEPATPVQNVGLIVRRPTLSFVCLIKKINK